MIKNLKRLTIPNVDDIIELMLHAAVERHFCSFFVNIDLREINTNAHTETYS